MSHDTLIQGLLRPGVRLIAPTWVTPNQLTTLRLFAGLGAAALFAGGHVIWFNAAGVLLLISMLFDRADGELARQTGQTSLVGCHYDIWSNCAAKVAIFVGIGIGIATPDTRLGLANIWLGGLAGFALAALFWKLYVLKLVTVQFYRLRNGRLTIDPDDAMVLVPILVWFGFAQPLLIAAAIVAPVVALWLAFSASQFKQKQLSKLNNSAGEH
jgi:archaetidylinositol phosphate synthase